jgi:pyridoxamine 5'-phosphate oxidase
LLRAVREREGRSPSARWLQLGSVAADGSPRVRTLVFRGWAEDAALDLLTDGRSAKSAELQKQPAVELCWLLPRARCQFRLRGQVLALPAGMEQQERLGHWQSLTPAGRALWGWPEPGAPLNATAAFPAELADDTPLPPHFQLLRIGLEQVELLELSDQPHRRRRWCRAGGWQEEQLNP